MPIQQLGIDRNKGKGAELIATKTNKLINSLACDRYSDVGSLAQAISAIPSIGGGSNLATALDLLRTRVFVSGVVRPSTSHLAVVVTDQVHRCKKKRFYVFYSGHVFYVFKRFFYFANIFYF